MSTKRNLHPVIFWLWKLRAFRLYANGDTYGVLLNGWNPISWFLLVFGFTFLVVAQGLPKTLKYPQDLGLVVDPFFKKHPEQLVWIKH